jgi:hypothetical protein
VVAEVVVGSQTVEGAVVEQGVKRQRRFADEKRRIVEATLFRYSVRSAFMGSTCVARNAGRYMAASETATSNPAAMPYADASKFVKGYGDLLAK